MIKLFKTVYYFFFSKEKLKTNNENSVKFQNNQEDNDIQKEYFESLKLNSMRNLAIIKCNGCTDEVFVLKLEGEDIGYHPNLNDLAVKNGFHASSVYRYWKNKQTDKRFLDKYEIVNLS